MIYSSPYVHILRIKEVFKLLRLGLLPLRDKYPCLLPGNKDEVPEVPLKDKPLAAYEAHRLHKEVS